MLSMTAQARAVLLEGQPLVLLVQNDRVVLILRFLADEEIDFLSGLLLAAGHDASLQCDDESQPIYIFANLP